MNVCRAAILICLACITVFAQGQISRVWVADNGDGTYTGLRNKLATNCTNVTNKINRLIRVIRSSVLLLVVNIRGLKIWSQQVNNK